MGPHPDAPLVADTLRMAGGDVIPRRGVIHHMDRGNQYACQEYQTLLANHGLHCSMSRKESMEMLGISDELR
jgi:transposase InsO family protein